MILSPPVAPMLARLAHELPRGDYLYEPKWDGFRCLAFVAGGEVALQSRHGRPLQRYFPELVEALRGLGRDLVLDGEIVVMAGAGLDFAALMTRLHPAATRVARLRHEVPACFVAFDLLADGDEDLRAAPFAARRDRLVAALGRAPRPLLITPATDDEQLAAEWLDRFQGRGLDGVVAKPRALAYQPGKRVLVKIKKERTVECVVAGLRAFGDEPAVGSLLLGLHAEGGALVHVGVCSNFRGEERRRLAAELRSHVVPLAGHPWERGFHLGASPLGRLRGAAGRWDPDEMSRDWVPLAPRLVAEVGYDQVDVDRFRHPARFLRWRPDREAASCTLDQLETPPPW